VRKYTREHNRTELEIISGRCGLAADRCIIRLLDKVAPLSRTRGVLDKRSADLYSEITMRVGEQTAE
jgi:hypothetical protein